MNEDQAAHDIINPSLLDPVMIAGVERRVLGLEFLFVVVLMTLKGLTLLTIVLATLITIPVHVAAVRMSRADPRMFDMVVRHLAWRRHYPPHGSHRAAHPAVKPCIRRSR